MKNGFCLFLSNCFEVYIKKGGRIQIRFPEENPNQLCMIDNGIGIAAKVILFVFEQGFTGYNEEWLGNRHTLIYIFGYVLQKSSDIYCFFICGWTGHNCFDWMGK